MTRLGIGDYDAVLAFLEEAHALDGPAPFTPELLDRLAHIADCEMASFYEIDYGRRIFLRYIPCAAEGGSLEELDEARWTSRRMHELTRQKFLSGPRPVVLADVFTERERTDPAFNYNFGEFGFTDQIHVSLDPTRHWFAEVTLFRGRDLGQRERLIMKLLRPHLVAMYGAGKIRHRLAQASKELDTEAMAPLTPREREVIHCVAEGLTNREIAAELVVEPSTVRKHLKNVYEKLGVGSRTAALATLRHPAPTNGVARNHRSVT
jgi:RNA polymerase sigma factor (sigma-70 family)